MKYSLIFVVINELLQQKNSDIQQFLYRNDIFTYMYFDCNEDIFQSEVKEINKNSLWRQ